MNIDGSHKGVKQHIRGELRYSVMDFNNEFPNDSACLELHRRQRWPKGVTMCPKCSVERKHHRVGNRTAYACDHCGNHRYPLAGTIFEKSSTSLKIWFYAMYLMGSTRCGISANRSSARLASRTRPHGACSTKSARCCLMAILNWRNNGRS